MKPLLLNSLSAFLFCSVLFFNGILQASNPCGYSIAYDLIEGNYTDVLGKVDADLTVFAEALTQEFPEYCDIEIRVSFSGGLQDRQLVHKNPASRNHYFKVVYRAPSYRVTVRNSDREVILEKEFVEEWISVKFPKGDTGYASKDDLYQRWNLQRKDFYTSLEESYNNYTALKTFLHTIVPNVEMPEKGEQDALMAINKSSAPEPPSTPALLFLLIKATEEMPYPDIMGIFFSYKPDDQLSGVRKPNDFTP